MKRLRFQRRWGTLVFWGGIGVVLLLIALSVLNHHVLSRDSIVITVDHTTFSRPGGDLRYTVAAP